MISLSKRLQTVASFVPSNCNLIDVGCDHALLDIYLAQNNKNIKILATDINENPLKIAEENIKKYHLEDKIKLKKMNGIEEVNNNINTIVISGMGGILITDILNKKEKLINIENIILCPNNDFPLVREKVTKLGYKIDKESIVIDKGKTYLVIKFIKGKQSKIDYLFGTLKNNKLEELFYYNNLYMKNKNNLKMIPNKYFIKKIKIKHENKKIRKFLNKK